MIKSMTKFILACFLLFIFSGCVSSNNFTPIKDKSKSYRVYNVSYNIPADGEWYFGDKNDFKVILTSGKEGSFETYVAKIEVMHAGSLSDDDAYELMQKRFLSEEKTKYRDRYEIMDNSTSKSHERDIFCIKLYSKVKDYKPSKKPTGVDFLIQETLERMCRHPKDPTKFVVIGFSKRSEPNKIATNFREKADDFFNNINFL